MPGPELDRATTPSTCRASIVNAISDASAACFRCARAERGAPSFAASFPFPGEPVIVKRRYSAFHGTELDVLLRSRGIRTIVLVGVAMNVCVEAAARDACMRDD